MFGGTTHFCKSLNNLVLIIDPNCYRIDELNVGGAVRGFLS